MSVWYGRTVWEPVRTNVPLNSRHGQERKAEANSCRQLSLCYLLSSPTAISASSAPSPHVSLRPPLTVVCSCRNPPASNCATLPRALSLRSNRAVHSLSMGRLGGSWSVVCQGSLRGHGGILGSPQIQDEEHATRRQYGRRELPVWQPVLSTKPAGTRLRSTAQGKQSAFLRPISLSSAS